MITAGRKPRRLGADERPVMEPIRLKTFPKPKYLEQLVVLDGSPKLRLFDACDLFMTNGTWAERERVQDEARTFAERFVAQMNAAALQPVT